MYRTYCADIHDIPNKWADFSSGTIAKLLKQGIDDALNSLAKDIKKYKGIHAAYGQKMHYPGNKETKYRRSKCRPY